jgi:hypothetical protein
MGVVIEICVKYPGGPTRITVADIYGGRRVGGHPGRQADTPRALCYGGDTCLRYGGRGIRREPQRGGRENVSTKALTYYSMVKPRYKPKQFPPALLLVRCGSFQKLRHYTEPATPFLQI